MMRPRVGLRNLVSRLKQVVLPAPFGPIRACTVPRATFRLMPLTATNPAKSLVRSSVSRTVSALIDRTFPWSSRCSRVRTAPLSRRGRNTDRYHLVAISSLGVAPGMCSHRAHRRSGARWWWWFSTCGGNRLSGNQCAWHLADTFSRYARPTGGSVRRFYARVQGQKLVFVPGSCIGEPSKIEGFHNRPHHLMKVRSWQLPADLQSGGWLSIAAQ